MKRMTVLAVVIAAFGSACSDQQAPLSPRPGDPQPFADIVDGHNDPTRSQFFFLPPIRPIRLQPPATGFNPSLRPVVEIYECTLRPDHAGCGALGIRVSTLTMDDPSAIDRLYVLPNLKQYAALWRAYRVPNLDATKFYRIQVKVGPTILGYADVDIVRTLRQLLAVDRDDFVPAFEDFVLPIAFWIGDGALCEPGSPACSSETIKLDEGGTVQLAAAGEDFRLDIRAGTAATSGGQPVTDVTFTLEACDGIDVDLRKVGQCLRVTTLFETTGPPAPLELTTPALISMCVLQPGLPESQERLITLHQQDGAVIRALPHAFPACDVIGTRSTGLLGLASAGWRAVRDFAGSLITPRPLYAKSTAVVFDIGGGGETDLFGEPPSGSSSAPFEGPALAAAAAAATGTTVSDFQFALPAKMDYVDPDDASRTIPANTPAVFQVSVTDARQAAITGGSVTFTITQGDATPEVVTAPVVEGIAQITRTLAAGTTTVVASGFGIASPGRNGPLVADPDGDGPIMAFDPFWPDVDVPPEFATPPIPRTAVILATGEVAFTATAGLADLSVSDLSVSPASPASGYPVTIGAVVTNSGTAPAASARVNLCVVQFDETGGTSSTCFELESPILGPGASAPFSGTLEALFPGAWHVYASVDTFEVVTESDETNNKTLGPEFTVSPPAIDQLNDPATTTSFHCGGTGESLYQSFTPGSSLLTAVELRLRTGGSFPNEDVATTINVREGSPEGRILGTATVFVVTPQPTGRELLVRLTFSDPITVTPGSTLVIEWLATDGTILSWMGSQSDTYPGGNMFGCTRIAVPDHDLNFRTFSQ